jgi:hypothetical protein
VELDPAQTLGRPLLEEEVVVLGPVLFTCTVPSSLGRARMSRAAISKKVSFSKPLAEITSQRWLITSSPWVVTFIFTRGL